MYEYLPADSTYLLALEKYGLKEYEAAIAFFNIAIQLNSLFSADAYYWCASAKYRLKDYNAAITDFDKAIELNSQYSADAYYWRASAKYSLKEYGAAIADFYEAIQQKSQYSADAHYWCATVKYILKDYEAAIADFDEAIRKNSLFSPNAFFYRGSANCHIKNYEAAIADLDMAISRNSEYKNNAAQKKSEISKLLRKNEVMEKLREQKTQKHPSLNFSTFSNKRKTIDLTEKEIPKVPKADSVKKQKTNDKETFGFTIGFLNRGNEKKNSGQQKNGEQSVPSNQQSLLTRSFGGL
jgi:tetratricopeptide (TPR) repeat protein